MVSNCILESSPFYLPKIRHIQWQCRYYLGVRLDKYNMKKPGIEFSNSYIIGT